MRRRFSSIAHPSSGADSARLDLCLTCQRASSAAALRPSGRVLIDRDASSSHPTPADMTLDVDTLLRGLDEAGFGPPTAGAVAAR